MSKRELEATPLPWTLSAFVVGGLDQGLAIA